MGVLDRMKDSVGEGLNVSKGLYQKAVNKAKEVGDTGVRKVEVLQLESRVKDLKEKLGLVVYDLLYVQNQGSIDKETVGVKDLLDKIETLQVEIQGKTD